MTKSALSDRRQSASSGASAAFDDVAASTFAHIMDEERGAVAKTKPPSSLLKTIFTKSQPPTQLPQSSNQTKEGELMHDGNNASIVLEEQISKETPWTPKSLGRAKTAIIYKQTLNDTLLILERNIFFFSEWKPYFVSLQEDHMLMFSSRERWEQGLKPDKIIELHHMLMLSDMKVDVVSDDTAQQEGDGNVRLFHRKLLETDELDEWLNEELRQNLVIGSSTRVDGILSDNPTASARCVIEFGSYNQNTFELWTKSIRRVLQAKRDNHANEFSDSIRNRDPFASYQANNASPTRRVAEKSWVSPGQDSKLTLHQSEIWCNRVLSGEKDKAESEMRRIIAMEKLVAQVTSPRMALLVYEKVSRVHELFVANSRREIEKLDGRGQPISAEILNFFADHLKRKYSVFLILALAYGVGEEHIREAHETMCLENAAVNAGVGGGSGEQQRTFSAYGFNDPESLSLYEKYRDAALNYHKMNYGDTAAAEEEDAIMHLPVMLQVAIIRHDLEESSAMMSILDTVKARLAQHCSLQENNS